MKKMCTFGNTTGRRRATVVEKIKRRLSSRREREGNVSVQSGCTPSRCCCKHEQQTESLHSTKNNKKRETHKHYFFCNSPPLVVIIHKN